VKHLAILIFGISLLQCSPNSSQVETVNKPSYRLISYNVENLFDTWDEEFKFDDDFTPTGRNYWGRERYEKKLNDIGKVLVNVSGDEVPAIIGLVEIENKTVLEDLLAKSPLQKFQYAIVHEESPDERGIDVALLYDTEQFRYLDHQIGRIEFPSPIRDRTRDMLMVKGMLGGDTVYVSVNHWPSRRGGDAETELKRIYVAKQLKEKTDAILDEQPNAGIIIMGDFNDTPLNRSVEETLAAKPWGSEDARYINMFYAKAKAGEGTYKYQNQWNMLDQFIVSYNLTDDVGNLFVTENSATIYDADWLKEGDPVYPGDRIFRTFRGPRYVGGYSDHFPIVLDVYKR